MIRPNTSLFKKGFTIIELLIVVVVIGILVTVVVVAYNGIQGSARDKSVLSDLDALDGIETDYGIKNNVAGKAWYSGSGSDSDIDFTPSAGNVIDVVASTTDYCIRGYNTGASTYNSISNAATKESSPGTCNLLAASTAAGGSGGGGVPNVPTGLAVVNTQSFTINLSWSSAAGATTYTAQCASNLSFSSGLGTSNTTDPVVTTSISGLTPGTEYCRVRASNIAGDSAWSSAITTSVPAGPVGWWLFNGNANDNSGSGMNGTVNGASLTTGQNGSSNSAYTFTGNGTTSYIALPNNSVANVSVFSMSAWIKPQSTLANTIIGTTNSGGAGPQFRYSSSTNSMKMEVLKQNIASIGQSTTTVPTGSWSFVVVTYDATGLYKFYINGLAAGSGTNLQAFTFSGYEIGRKDINTSTEVFNGSMDDVRIYNRILPSTEVSAMYTDGAQ